MIEEILYTARKVFDMETIGVEKWNEYIKWSRLKQLKEVVSLDCQLNGLVFKVNHSEDGDWDFIITDDMYETDLFNSFDFVLNKSKEFKKFNFIAAIKSPNGSQKKELESEYEFMGYELLDYFYEHSALTNCGGFDESFQVEELNEYGLIEKLERAVEVQENLLKNNPEENHADCNLFEIWRHKTIGRI